MNISKSLKHFRLSACLTQLELAEQLYISRQAISKWENNINYPDIETIIFLSQIYSISINELLDVPLPDCHND